MRTRLAPATLTVAALILTACSSNATATQPSRAITPLKNASTTHSSSTPASSRPALVSKPLVPPPVQRTLHRPPGAKMMGLDTCVEPDKGVAVFTEQFVFERATVAEQVSGLIEVVQAAQDGLRLTRTKLEAWLAGGYPASFPAVHDLTVIVETERKFIQAGTTRDLAAMPGLYRQFMIGFDQYNTDLNSPDLCLD